MKHLIAILLGAALGSVGCHAAETPSTLLPIYNARVPVTGVLSGGQPTTDQVEAAAAAGFLTVINLRTEQETGFEWEPALVEKLEMRYVPIPISGADSMTRENVERLDAALEEGLARGPVLLHCASGNRIGAMLALRAAWLDEVPAEEALAFGRSSGMTSLEKSTRTLLGIDEPAAEDAPRE